MCSSGHEQDSDRADDDVHGVDHHWEEDERHGRREVSLETNTAEVGREVGSKGTTGQKRNKW